jgi:hypothetical protein
MVRSRFALLFAVCLVVVLHAPTALAQSAATTGAIEGTVVDESGGVLPGVSVALRNTATNYEATVVTGPNGRFRGPLLPLGPYRITATLFGFAKSVREGVNLAVGQSVNLALTMKLATKAEEIVVAENPVIETTRSEGSTRIDTIAIRELPNNGRNSRLPEAHRESPIVQGPDGDMISVNGQKGIANNVSVDGADFNNPFFGEQRGGQRPAFTFNLDSVQEVVVIADGANAEYGRSSSGFVNVITKSGTNTLAGTVHLFYKNDSLASEATRADGTSAPKFDSSQLQGGFTLGGPLMKDRLFFFAAVDAQGGTSTKQTDPNRIEQRVVDYFASIGSPDENGPIDRSNDAFVALGKVDWFVSPRHTATLRGTYTKSSQENGTFDVDSWGRSANATEDNWSRSLSGTLISNFTSTLNEFRFQLAREDRPRPYTGPNITGQSRPLPDTAFDFGKSYRFGEPFFIPVDYHDTRIQLNDNVTVLKGNHELKAGFEFNRVEASPVFRGLTGRFIFSADGPDYARNRYCRVLRISNARGSARPGRASASPAGGRRRITAEQAGTQTIRQDEPASRTKWQPVSNLTVQLGLRWEAQIEPLTPADRSSSRTSSEETSEGPGVPSGRQHPLRQEHVAAAHRHHVGPDERRPDRREGQRRPLLRPDRGADTRLDPVDERQPRAEPLPRQLADGGPRPGPGLSEPDPAVGDRDSVPAGRLRHLDGLPEPQDAGRQRRHRARGPQGLRVPAQVQLREDDAPDPLREPQRRPARLSLVDRAERRAERRRVADGRRILRPEPLPGRHVRTEQAVVEQLPVPGELHALVGQVG